MKKAIGALALAALLLTVAVWNVRHVHRFTEELTEQVETARALWTSGDGDGALRALYGALEDWRGGESYTHVFIRHAEIDAVTDAFYDAAEAILNGEAGTPGALDRLEAHLHCIDSMEHVTMKSVF